MTLPPLPESVPSPLGPVPVLVVRELHTRDGREECLGFFNPVQRTIELDAEAVPVVQWCTLFHEACHVAIWDSGLTNVLTEEQIEAVCDCVAAARVAEMLYRSDTK